MRDRTGLRREKPGVGSFPTLGNRSYCSQPSALMALISRDGLGPVRAYGTQPSRSRDLKELGHDQNGACLCSDIDLERVHCPDAIRRTAGAANQVSIGTTGREP